MGSYFSRQAPPAPELQNGALPAPAPAPELNTTSNGVAPVASAGSSGLPDVNESTKNATPLKRPAEAWLKNGKSAKRPRTVPPGHAEGEHQRFCIRCKSIFWLSKKDITKLVNNAPDVPDPVALHKIARWPYFFATFRTTDAEAARSSLGKMEFRGERFEVTDASMPSERRARADENVARSDERVFEQRDAGTVTAPWGTVPYGDQKTRMMRVWSDALVCCQKRMMNDKLVRRGTPWLRDLKPKDPVCPLDEGVFCEEQEHRDFYRNKNEFTVGMSPPKSSDGAQTGVAVPIVGYSLGQSKDGDFRIGKLEDNCRTTSKTARKVAEALEDVVKRSGQPVYNRKNHEGYWRLVTVRSSARTSQVIVIVLVCAQGALPKSSTLNGYKKDVANNSDVGLPDDKVGAEPTNPAVEKGETSLIATMPSGNNLNSMGSNADALNDNMDVEGMSTDPHSEEVKTYDAMEVDAGQAVQITHPTPSPLSGNTVSEIREKGTAPSSGVMKQESEQLWKIAPQNSRFARRNALMRFDALNTVPSSDPADNYLTKCLRVNSSIAMRNQLMMFDSSSNVRNEEAGKENILAGRNSKEVSQKESAMRNDTYLAQHSGQVEPSQSAQTEQIQTDDAQDSQDNIKTEKELSDTKRILDDGECQLAVLEALRSLFHEESFGLHWQRSDELTPRPAVTPMEHVHGLAELEEELLGLRINVHPSAFFQVNTVMAEKLYTVIRDWASVTKDTTVLDVCCGTGTIGLSMAKHARAVFGVDLSEPAIKSAKANAKRNNITNATFVAGAAEKVISEVMQLIPNNFDCVAVLDPPRDGVAPNVIGAVRGAEKVKRIVYVACKPKNAWKNILQLCRPTSKAFRGMPFRPVRAVGVDLFPHTPHGELVFLLERAQ